MLKKKLRNNKILKKDWMSFLRRKVQQPDNVHKLKLKIRLFK